MSVRCYDFLIKIVLTIIINVIVGKKKTLCKRICRRSDWSERQRGRQSTTNRKMRESFVANDDSIADRLERKPQTAITKTTKITVLTFKPIIYRLLTILKT